MMALVRLNTGPLSRISLLFTSKLRLALKKVRERRSAFFDESCSRKTSPRSQGSFVTSLRLANRSSRQAQRVAKRTREIVSRGELPNIAHVNNADITVKLILQKAEAQAQTGAAVKMAVFGALEARLLVVEIASATIGVIASPEALIGSEPMVEAGKLTPEGWSTRSLRLL
ncbi:hypothetical protein FRB97_002735 [Tulasnella sp. 331]|nr:hypothetical protein FRB97_002735 [Tulasnella sp. 331]